MDVREETDASLREVMSVYPTGVTVVAASDPDGSPYGLTVNSFTSLSLEPPLVLVCIGQTSGSHDRLIEAPAFTVNVLAAHQEEVAFRFSRDPSEGRFDDLQWWRATSGAPVLGGVAAWLECSVHEILAGGDHSIVVGRVQRSAVSDRPALLFHRGRLGPTAT